MRSQGLTDIQSLSSTHSSVTNQLVHTHSSATVNPPPNVLSASDVDPHKKAERTAHFGDEQLPMWRPFFNGRHTRFSEVEGPPGETQLGSAEVPSKFSTSTPHSRVKIEKDGTPVARNSNFTSKKISRTSDGNHSLSNDDVSNTVKNLSKPIDCSCKASTRQLELETAIPDRHEIVNTKDLGNTKSPDTSLMKHNAVTDVDSSRQLAAHSMKFTTDPGFISNHSRDYYDIRGIRHSEAHFLHNLLTTIHARTVILGNRRYPYGL